MKLIYHLNQLARTDQLLVGGKAWALARMKQAKLPVPPAICVSTEAYNLFLDETGLRAQILMEYLRKPFDQMRWEEMWDCALRIQHLFAKTPIPASLSAALTKEIRQFFGRRPVAVRSSAVGEDSSQASFAGLHASFLNIRGAAEVLEHVKQVWASTWSDAAILYRQDIGLDVDKSSMAVVIQELIQGQVSGVTFGRSPIDPTQAVVEAVYGLNQGLVDGTVEPDRWILDRASGRIVSHTQPVRTQALMPARQGVKSVRLSAQQQSRPPLTGPRVKQLFRHAQRLAQLFGSDQDVEWTYDQAKLRLLQSRPITTTGSDTDERKWYLTLRRSFEDLRALRTEIEDRIMPGMAADAASLKRMNLAAMSDQALATEIVRRAEICENWKQQYWDFCIPFAHGIRLFGMVYNHAVQPDNPYEFLDLLARTGLESVKRNNKLQQLARQLKDDQGLARQVRAGKVPPHTDFARAFQSLAEDLRIPQSGATTPAQLQRQLLTLISEMADSVQVSAKQKRGSKAGLKRKFLCGLPQGDREFGLQLLDLARASYRLRDDDNIYLGQVERRLQDALHVARERSLTLAQLPAEMARSGDMVKCLRDPNYRPEQTQPQTQRPSVADEQIRPRQLLGQPAGPGLATGRARVIKTTEDLFAFKRGEVLVCDAIDPNMTFVVPLAAAIVERRGGMLIHGAIIAREYGLPCVTGIPEAETHIRTGMQITVDGYLGMVTINTQSR